jgi:hypothetical protein
VPTSVLLAVLAAAGLLALAPALVRRYDATERLVAERAQSTARVLDRRRRRRTVPGWHPVNPPRISGGSVGLPSGRVPSAPVSSPAGRVRSAPVSSPAGARRNSRLRSVPRSMRRVPRRADPGRHSLAVYRRRRVFAALLLLNVVELAGVVMVGPGFWISFSVTGTLLVAYVVHLRNRALTARRRRREEARKAAWLAKRQAEVRLEQARRAVARREAQRRLAAQREAVRRAALGLDRVRHLPAVAEGGAGMGAASVSYRRSGGLRGRPYEAGRAGSHPA